MVSRTQIINRTLNFFNVKEQLKKRLGVLDDDAFLKPFITVAREPGSGGAPIAKALAEQLDFEFVDEQIVEEIAKSTRKRKAIIKEIDEKSRTMVNDLVHQLLNREYVDESAYITELVRVILSYAHKGNCVILGRGGNFITPFAKGLHVSITAPYDIRVQRAMDYEGHSEKKAKEVIAKVEKERARFINQYFRKKIRNRDMFDLILNTSYYTVPQARDVIVGAFRQKFT